MTRSAVRCNVTVVAGAGVPAAGVGGTGVLSCTNVTVTWCTVSWSVEAEPMASRKSAELFSRLAKCASGRLNVAVFHVPVFVLVTGPACL